ncbi:MAG: GGDEF domain-containing phosphodiesterase [Lachnospiraceae bacterium]
MKNQQEQWIKEKYQQIPEQDREKYAFGTLKIKRFRTVNRIYGREIGDELLELVNERIKSCLEEGEYVAQLNINYFNILFRYTSDEQLLDRMIDIVRVVRDMPDPRFGKHIFSGFGAYRLPKEPIDFYVAQYNADLCRTESTHNKYRNAYIEVYGLTYQDPNEFFLDPESRIESAIEDGCIRLFLQPKVNLKTGAITGAEALVRWIDPVTGMIPVNSFLPSLNESGLIRNVDLFLFDKVCSYIEYWYLNYGKKITVSVNLAGCSFNYDEFFQDYKTIFEKYKAPKECIEFELLESIVLNKVDRVKRIVNQIVDYGFSCSLDDFGSGFSSYNVLTTTNLAQVKIDRSLFKNCNNPKEKIVIRHIIRTAQELNMGTVAEGVESEEYVQFLRELNCDYIQGYVFYKPMPAEEFQERFIIGDEKIMLSNRTTQ